MPEFLPTVLAIAGTAYVCVGFAVAIADFRKGPSSEYRNDQAIDGTFAAVGVLERIFLWPFLR